MGSCASVGNSGFGDGERNDMNTEIEYADTCVENGSRCRKMRDFAGAVEWFNEALRIQCVRYSIPLEATEDEIEAMELAIERQCRHRCTKRTRHQ